jgi:hypothetical protein
VDSPVTRAFGAAFALIKHFLQIIPHAFASIADQVGFRCSSFVRTSDFIMLLRIALFIFLIIGAMAVGAQNVQTIRGQVVDKESRISIPGVNVVLMTDTAQLTGTTTDVNGMFRMEKVPVGRHSLGFSSIGYKPVQLRDLVVGSGRELVIAVELEETITELQEFEVKANAGGQVRNEMALIGARQFSVEETERYAGSRGDPGRMASNYAGVQGADDSRNDIVIRGNSPQGVLWRFEGVNIPNPNHFAIPGTSGGPVTIINNKYLDDSDLFTGAFPAEYSNATAGVFDLRMRNGNNEKHEATVQFGFLGTEVLLDGPIDRKTRSSYLVSYRYSTSQLFQFMGIKVGTDAIPRYQDGAFRVSLPIGSRTHLALWGIGGDSSIDIVLSEQEEPDTATLIYGDNDRDQYFRSRMATVGATFSRSIDENTYLKVTAAAGHSQVRSHHEYIYRHVQDDRYMVDSLPEMLRYQFVEEKFALYSSINRKFGRRTTLKAGLNMELQPLSYVDSARRIMVGNVAGNQLDDWRVRWDASASVQQLQPYIQMKHQLSEKNTITVGITGFHSTINDNSTSPIEPRAAFTHEFKGGQRVSIGYGLHSQLQPGYLYFYRNETTGHMMNRGIGLSKSHHFVIAYDRSIGNSIRFRSEVYHQYLFNVPVTAEPSAFSLINSGAGFQRLFPDSLVNKGLGRNSGIELTIERPFKKGYYFLLTASLFDADYRGSDGIWRNTSFNGHFALNALLSKEFSIKDRSVITVGGKVTATGGRWYGNVDREASDAAQEIVFEDATMNTRQFRPYFRTDLKLGYRWNRPKVMHEFGVDLINLTGQRNILTLTYAPGHPTGDPIREEYQLGFLPIFYYKLEI